MRLRPFQRRAVRALESGRYDVLVLCLPRAQGKSTLAALLCARALNPADVLFNEGTESHLVASTISAARRTCFKLLRRLIEGSPNAADYVVSESANACHVRHAASNTRISVVAGSARATLGLVGCPLVIVDEPGSYELAAGSELWDSLSTAIGKPESPLKLFLIGHLAPRATRAGHWFYDLVHKGTRGRTYVQFVQGRVDRWDSASEIRRCSPLSWRYPESRSKLLEERDDAKVDSGAKAKFCSYRLNLPTEDENTVLLTVEDWERVLARPVPDADGRPLVGVDLGRGEVVVGGGRGLALRARRGGRGRAGDPNNREAGASGRRAERHLSTAGGRGRSARGDRSARAGSGRSGEPDSAVATGGDRLRPLPAAGATRRCAGVSAPAEGVALVGIDSGYPGVAEDGEGWRSRSRDGEPRPVDGEPERGCGGVRRLGQ